MDSTVPEGAGVRNHLTKSEIQSATQGTLSPSAERPSSPRSRSASEKPLRNDWLGLSLARVASGIFHAPDYSRRRSLAQRVGRGARLAPGPCSADAQTAARNADRPSDVVTLIVNGGTIARGRLAGTLLDASRERIGLTGTKRGATAQCGACTVLIDGKRVLCCLTLAVMAGGRAVTTVEGLAGRDGTLHRCSRRSSTATRSSAAIARRARFFGDRLRRGGSRRDRRRHSRIDERQSLPLRRLYQHRPAIRQARSEMRRA